MELLLLITINVFSILWNTYTWSNLFFKLWSGLCFKTKWRPRGPRSHGFGPYYVMMPSHLGLLEKKTSPLKTKCSEPITDPRNKWTDGWNTTLNSICLRQLLPTLPLITPPIRRRIPLPRFHRLCELEPSLKKSPVESKKPQEPCPNRPREPVNRNIRMKAPKCTSSKNAHSARYSTQRKLDYQVDRLNSFHMRCLRCILGVKCQRITDSEILTHAGVPSMYSLVSQHRLRWIGYVNSLHGWWTHFH